MATADISAAGAQLVARDIAAWCGGAWDPGPPEDLVGVSTDSRNARRGSLFVALVGENQDGHAFVDAAFERGAAAALVSAASGRTGSSGKPVLVAADTLGALQAIAARYRRESGITVVGVTGSIGKTTVKELTARVLATAMPTAMTQGNLNNHVGVPLSLLGIKRGDRVGVFEAGVNHPGEMAPLADMLRPDWAIVTNIGPVHIEFFDSVRAIASEKAVLLEALSPAGTAVLCRDDEYFDVLRAAVRGRLVTVSMRGNADYVASIVDRANRRAKVVETAGGEGMDFQLPLPGEHQVCNALFAIAVARGHGIAWPAIRKALESYSPIALRWESSVIGGVTIINDAYNANPVSMRAALTAFAESAGSGAKFLVLGAMKELGRTSDGEHEALGRLVAGGPWAGLVTVGRDAECIAAAAAGGMAKERICVCGGHADAAATLKKLTRPGDEVLLKASRSVKLEEVQREYALLSV